MEKEKEWLKAATTPDTITKRLQRISNSKESQLTHEKTIYKKIPHELNEEAQKDSIQSPASLQSKLLGPKTKISFVQNDQLRLKRSKHELASSSNS